jgi:hypothetical protein
MFSSRLQGADDDDDDADLLNETYLTIIYLLFTIVSCGVQDNISFSTSLFHSWMS